MQETILYAGGFAAFIVLVIILEWNKIKRVDMRKLLSILVVLFFIGSSLAYLFLM